MIAGGDVYLHWQVCFDPLVSNPHLFSSVKDTQCRLNGYNVQAIGYRQTLLSFSEFNTSLKPPQKNLSLAMMDAGAQALIPDSNLSTPLKTNWITNATFEDSSISVPFNFKFELVDKDRCCFVLIPQQGQII
jgi:hypothetical protein